MENESFDHHAMYKRLSNDSHWILNDGTGVLLNSIKDPKLISGYQIIDCLLNILEVDQSFTLTVYS